MGKPLSPPAAQSRANSAFSIHPSALIPPLRRAVGPRLDGRLLASDTRTTGSFVRLYHLCSTVESGASDTTGTETSRRLQEAAPRQQDCAANCVAPTRGSSIS